MTNPLTGFGSNRTAGAGGVATQAPVFKSNVPFAPPGGEVGTPYSYDVAPHFEGVVESYVVYNGTLSNGLSLNAVSGILSGTPTGTLTIPSFSVAALNANGGAISNAHSFSVTESIICPVSNVGGVAPLFAYGAVKIVSSYDGPAIRVVRASDSEAQDIYFSGQNIDADALDAFLGAEVGTIDIWYDQSGNGNHALQTVSADRAIIERISVNGARTIIFNQSHMVLPATVTASRKSVHMFSVLEPAGATFGSSIVQLGADADQTTFFFGTVVNKKAYIRLNPGPNGSDFPPVTRPSFYEAISSPTQTFYAQNEESATAAATTDVTLTGGMIGNSTLSGVKGIFYAGAIVGYGRILDSTERQTFKSSCYSLFNIPDTVTRTVCFEGDSITIASSSTDVLYNGYAKQSYNLLSQPARVFNFATGGSQIQAEVTRYADQVGAVLTRYTTDNRIVFLMIGTNDLKIGARTAAQIYADIQTYAGSVRADGGKIIVATILPNKAWDATQQTTRNDLNTLIRDNWASFADGFCDFAADPTMGPQSAASDTSLYTDGLHPSQLGHSYLAPLAATAINALL